MAAVTTDITIAGPAEAIFDLVTTARFWPRWHPASRGVAGTTERPYLIGDAVRERGEAGGMPFELTWEIVEHIRPARVVMRSAAPPVSITYTFQDRDGSVHFRRELQYDEATLRAAGRDPAELGRLMQAQSEQALRQLKTMVEEILAAEQVI